MSYQIQTRYSRNHKIRLKLTDWCNLQCPFCHSEGAAGANDIDLNDETLISSLRSLRPYYDTIHLTGGEPTSYRHLIQVIDLLRSLDYKLAMTSNGLFNVDRVRDIASKLEYINISFHTLSPGYFQSFVRSAGASARVIDVVANNIDALTDLIPLRINTVISGTDDQQQLASVHHFAESRSLPLKLVPDWRSNKPSKEFAFEYLTGQGYELAEIVKIVPGSNVRRIFRHATRNSVEFKDIEHFRPDFLCGSCEIVDKCIESFSFVRIERSPAKFRLCIYKPEIDKEVFFDLFDRELKPLIQAAPWQQQ
jgi:molybdenum cofactor biosynthesis enzyme MoaA